MISLVIETWNLGDDLVRVERALWTLADTLAPQLRDVEDNRTSPGIEWNLTVDREAAGRYGVDVLSVGQAIQFVTEGVLAGRFRPDDSEDELE